MNENITIPYEEYKRLLIAELHLEFILAATSRAKYSHEIEATVNLIRFLRDPGSEVNDDAE